MSRTYVQTANEIISRALRICGVLAEKQTMDDDQWDQGLTALNGLINMLSERDPLLWSKEWKTQVFAPSSIVSNNSTYYRCIRSHTSAATTEPGVGGDNTTYWYEDSGLLGESSAWATATVYHPSDIVSNDGSYYYCLIAHESAAATEPGTGASYATYWKAIAAWATSTAYVSAGDFAYTSAHAITQAFLRYNNYDYPIKLALFNEILEPTDKTAEDIPTHLYFDKQNSNNVYLWPIPEPDVVATGVLHFLCLNYLPDIDSQGDPVPVPTGWFTPMAFMLAEHMAFEFGLQPDRIQVIQAQSEKMQAIIRRAPYREVTDVPRITPCF